MKKFILTVLALILVFCTSCTALFALPDSVTIGNTEYRRAFVGTLYPTDHSFLSPVTAQSDAVMQETYYHYPPTVFDCRIAYDTDAEPNVYFANEQFDEAVSFYTDSENFRFFCMIGNIHSETDHQIFEIQDMNALMLERLAEYAAANDYSPFAPESKREYLIEVPFSPSENYTANEIRFYKESTDGAAFTACKGYCYVLHDNQLCLLYFYDFANADAPVMCLKAIPTEISDYFRTLLESLSE